MKDRSLFFLLAALTATMVRAQNDCATALPVTEGVYTVTGFDGTIPLPDCTNEGGGATAGEWYRYTPVQDTLLTVTTDRSANAGLDTRVQIYTGDCDALVCVGGNDDSAGTLCVVSLSVQAGVTYTIAFDNRWGSSGFEFQLIESAPPSPASSCVTAIPVGVGTWTVDTITGVLPTPDCIAGPSAATNGAWYSYASPMPVAVTVTTDLPQNAGLDTRFHVYQGDCQFLYCLTGNDDAGNAQLSTVTFNAQAGFTYYIAFDDNGGSSGFDFQVSEGPVVPSCETALPITAGTYTVDSIWGLPPDVDCSGQGMLAAHASWYAYTPDQAHAVTVTTDLPQNTDGDTRLQVYSGFCGFLTCMGGDGAGGNAELSTVTFNALPFNTYYIVFDDRWSDAGFDFQLTEADPISSCETALEITTGIWTVDSITGVVPTIDCIAETGQATHGQWFTYTPPIDGALTVSTDLPQNAGGDTRVHIYTGFWCGALTCLGGDDDSGEGLLSVATVNVLANQPCYIAFDDNWSAAGFDFELSLGPVVDAPIIFVPGPAISSGVFGVVDMDGDHLDDVVAPNSASVTIDFQQPDGTLVPTTIPTPVADNPASWSFCAGDIDKNGKTDMMYGGGGGATFMLASDDGSSFTEMSFPQYIFCQRTNMVDLDNDGDLDAFSCHDVDANVSFVNDGTGALTFHQGGLGPDCGNYGSIWVDYDDDHQMDCFIAKCGCDPVDQLHHNLGGGVFTDVASTYGLNDTEQSWSSAWGDFDNDGDMDGLIGSSGGGDHKLMRNDNGSFTNITAGSGFDAYGGSSIEWVTHDFNNDGYLDVWGGGGFMMGHGDMTFTPFLSSVYNGPVGDLNNDGFLDVVSGNILLMNTPNGNHWLTVTAVGTTSNASGIGARVRITSAMGTQIREIRSGDGFRYMSSLNAHFGLGADSVITDVTVYWPSGEISLLHDVPADTALTVVEGLSTGVAEATTDGSLQLYPNPVENTLYVRAPKELGNRAVRVMDATGKVVLRGMLHNEMLDVSGLSRGVYVLTTEMNGALLNSRFVKQ